MSWRQTLLVTGGVALTLASHAGAQTIHPQWSPDGEHIAYYHRHGSRADIVIVRADGSDVRRIPLPDGYHANPTWSPDGTEVAYVSGRPSMEGSWDLYVVDLESGEERQVTDTFSREMHPSWSPTGAWIAYVRRGSQGADVFIVRPDGRDRTQVTDTPGQEFHPKFSPRGHYLAYDADVDGRRQIVILDVGADRARAVTAFGPDSIAATPAWHPSGTRLAFSLQTGDERRLYLVNVDGTGLEALPTPGAGAPFWSPDGRFIAFHAHVDGTFGIYTIEVATGTVRRVSPETE